MRLTRDMKTEIVDALLAHKFKPLVTEMVKEVKIFAIAAHADHFGERLAKMNALPKGWLPEYDRMEGVCYKDEHFVICYNGNVRLLYVSHASQFIFHKYKNEENSGAKYLRHLSAETFVEPKNYVPLLDKVTALQKEYEEMRSELFATLNAFSVAEKLIEHWPEVEPFIPEYVPPVKNLPAVQSDQLNKKLGLPV